MGPVVTWRSHANLLFSNWLNHIVYAHTPYDLDRLRPRHGLEREKE